MQIEELSFEKIIEELHDGLYFVNKDRKITYWNKAAEEISGFSAEEVIGRACSDNILTHVDADGNRLCLSNCPLATTIADGRPRAATVYMHHKEGYRIPVSVRISTLTNKDGEVIGGIELFSDISSHEANVLRLRELEKMALLDNLTQLPNRNFMEQEFQSRLEETKRFGIPFGVFFMDIDHFKKFNDTYGHDLGDEVLKFIAKTFTNNSRSFDVYGRWGGEEFLAIIRNIEKEELVNLGNKVRQLVAHSYIAHEDKQLNVTISIGATMVEKTDTMDTLIKRADDMLYESKANGRNCLTIG